MLYKTYKQAFKIYIPPLLVITRESNGKYILIWFDGKVQNKTQKFL